MMVYPFLFVPAPGETVRDGEIRFDAAPPSTTRLYANNLDHTGAYVRTVLLAYGRGTTIHVELDPTTFAVFQVRDIPIGRAGFVEIPVVGVAAAGTLDGGAVDVSFLRVTIDELAPLALGADLVTLETAKAHLRITDTDHDDDVRQKLTAASATIRDYLKDRNDESWDATTCPPWVASAVLLMLGHLYEHRGDEFGNQNDNDARVWAAIENLLRRSRDPALA